MAQPIKQGSVDHPITIGRRFIKKFGFSNVSIEKFDIFIIDNKLAINPDSDDPKDPTYKQFKEERTRARGILNRVGPDMDDGQRFQINVLVRGQVYGVIPYGIAVVDNATNFGSQIQRLVEAKRRRISETSRKVEKLISYGGADRDEFRDIQRVLDLCENQTESFSDKMKSESHKYERGVEEAFKLADRLIEKYED